MMATWEDLDEEQEGAESQEEKEIVANLCFIADIVSNKEIEVTLPELELSYEELLDGSQTLCIFEEKLSKVIL